MTQDHNHKHISGFTIVELMIAMAFISLLLLAIVATVMQVGAIYNKGVILKSVNQAGRLVVADMKRTIAEGQVFDTNVAFKRHDHYEGSQLNPDYDGGRLCTGTYSYIWNTGKYVDPSDLSTQINKYSGSSGKQLHFVRVSDNGGQYCADTASGLIDPTNATELLSVGDLAVQDFHIDRLTNNVASGRALYSIRIVISNAETLAIDSVDNSCKPPSDDPTYQNYCAVNEFVFTAQAGNMGGQ